MKYTLFTLFLVFGLNIQAQEFRTQLGQQVPGFQMVSSTGQIYEIEDFRGKPLLIVLFGTHCGPCLRELPVIDERINKKYGKDEITILAIAASNHQLDVDNFRAKWDYDFIFVPDPMQKVFNLFAWSTIPRNVLVDKNGKIIFQSIGYNKSPFEKMAKLIEREVATMQSSVAR